MFDKQKIVSNTLHQLVQLKGKKFVLEHKENLRVSIYYEGQKLVAKILLYEKLNPQDLFDSKGNLCIDETEKPEVLYTFQCNVETGECTLII